MRFPPRQLKRLDMALLAILPVVATAFTLGLRLNYLWSILLLFGLPALWLSIRTPRMVARTAIFSAAMVPPFALALNHIGILGHVWYVPQSAFSYRLLGTVPVEDLVGCFLLVYGAVICYEHFLDKGRHRLVDRKMKYVAWPLLIFTVAFLTASSARPQLLDIPYAYAWIGLLFVAVPIASTLWFFPRLISKYAKVAAYFASLLAIFEFNGLTLGHWIFPGGDTIAWVSYLGFPIPVEELVFFILLSVVAVLAYYEFFDDDLR